MFLIDKCCCCVDLRTGCLIIGYLRLVINTVISQLLIFNFDKTCEALGISINLADPTVTYVLYITLAIYFLKVVFNIVLLFGLHKERRVLIQYYLLYSVFIIVITCVIYTTEIMKEQEKAHKYLIYILFHLYFLLVIRSHYLKMEDPEKEAIIKA